MRLKGFDRLVSEFQRLPGIGAKSAARLACYLLRSPREEADRLASAVIESREAVKRCSTCNTLTETDPCDICSDPQRDGSLLCVVEEPGNVAAPVVLPLPAPPPNGQRRGHLRPCRLR